MRRGVRGSVCILLCCSLAACVQAPELGGATSADTGTFAVTIDATGVSVTRFNVLGPVDVPSGPNVVTTVQLVAGGYELCLPTSNNCFGFSVGADGTLDYDPSLDGFVAGRGTSALTVTGHPITIDATGASATQVNVDLGDVYTGANQPTTLALIPGSYSMCVPASNNCFAFQVTPGFTVDFDPSLDGFVSGRGTAALVITGHPITIDATGASATQINVDFGAVYVGANQPTTLPLIPGAYRMCVPASNNCFLFQVTPSFTVDFDASLDGFVSGRGTATLVITGHPITIDATAVAATTFNVDFGGVYTGPNVATELPLVPGGYLMCVPASNNCFVFQVTPAFTIDFDHALDDHVFGRGSTTLFVGSHPPALQCVGTPADPVAIATAPDTCTAQIATPVAGTCSADAASCTFDGAPAETLGLGVHDVTVSATAASGLGASCTSYVSVIDLTAPSLHVAPAPDVLWPPDHKLVPIDLGLQAADNCGLASPPSCTVTSSDAPLALGSGNTDADVVWSGGRLFLRAERSGNGSGRTYTVSCSVRDTSGNMATASATVIVPHAAP